MRIKFIFFFILLTISNLSFAQSDYEYIQNFKKTVNNLEVQISNAQTVEDLRNIKYKINSFKNQNRPKADFISQSLYPKTFVSIFSNLDKEFESKRTIINKEVNYKKEIGVLKTEIKNLSVQMEFLSKSYLAKLNEIEVLKKTKSTNSEYTDNLKLQISELQKLLVEREGIIFSILDSMLFVQTKTNPEEAFDINKNILRLSNINFLKQLEILVNDNRTYLRNNQIVKDELFNLYNNSNSLLENLKKLSPETILFLQNYSDTKKSNITDVENSIHDWKNEIEINISKMIGSIFRENGFFLNDTNSVQKLFDSILDFAEKESVRADDQVKREYEYRMFVDSTWKKIESGYFEDLQKSNLVKTETIDAANQLFKDWGERVRKSPPYFLYIFITLIFMLIMIYIIAQAKRNKFRRKAKAKKKKEAYEKQKAMKNQR